MTKKIKCPKCGDCFCRLVRYGDSEPWMCPDCYLGLYLDHTPQTKWGEEDESDEVLQAIIDFMERHDTTTGGVICPPTQKELNKFREIIKKATE